MSRLPPLTTLRVFDAAARHLNMRLAANELGVTHGAVAQQIRMLEASLGIRLFNRGPQGLLMTEAGRIFHGPIRRAFSLIEEATNAVEGLSTDHRQAITITVPPSFAARWLIPRLARFSARHPDIDIRVLASESVQELGGRGRPDLAVRFAQPPFAAALSARLLIAVELLPVCNPSLANRIVCDSGTGSITLIDDGHALWPLWFEKSGLPSGSARSLWFSQSSLALEAALKGQGLALLQMPLIEEDLANGNLVAPFGTAMRLKSPRDYYLIIPKLSGRRREVTSFADWLMIEAGSG